MTCRHSPGARDCSSHPDNIAARAEENAQYERELKRKEREKKEQETYAMTPDKEKYQIVDVVRVGPHLVMKVLYPNCTKCSYEGNKVMVFLNVTEAQALRWRVIDPHFRDPKAARSAVDAPGPAARFPASEDGWQDALDYAQRKART